jgi:hypothetical protein
MAGYLCVSGCEVQDMGSKRIYHLNDNSVVIEHPITQERHDFNFIPVAVSQSVNRLIKPQ